MTQVTEVFRLYSLISEHLGVENHRFLRKLRSGLRSLSAPDSSAFVQTFTPDAEGKLQSMTWQMPGKSGAQAFASYRYAGGRVLFRTCKPAPTPFRPPRRPHRGLQPT